MLLVKKLNKRLEKSFNGKVHAVLKDGCLHLTGVLNDWNDVVRAGLMSVNKKKYTVVNDINFTGGRTSSMGMPFLATNLLAGKSPDVLIIGGGIIGCSIARELMRYKLDVMLVEKEHDVALHASGRNNGTIHSGMELKKGQLKKFYNDAGNSMYPQVCSELNVPFHRTGQYLCFTNTLLKPAVLASLLYWKLTGVQVKYISRSKLLIKEPHLRKKIKYALFFPSAGVVCPYGLTIAYAENAVNNGASFNLDTVVIDMDVWNGNIISVLTNHGKIHPKLVINAAGVFADEIARFANDRFFSIHPKRSTNIVFDKKTGHLVSSIISLIKNFKVSFYKKIDILSDGVVRTVSGNLLVGSNAVETYEKEDFSTNRDNMKTVLAKYRRTIPELSRLDIITYFSGIRAVTYEDDFIISFGKNTRNIIHAAGIQLPGLTAAPAIAADVSKMAAKYLKADENADFNPIRKAIVRSADLPDEERDSLIKDDPNYGMVICNCEEVSRGEIISSLNRSIPCDTLDGVKRRVRAGMGRCQGSFCSPHVMQIISEKTNLPIEKINKMSMNSNILFGNVKETLYDGK